MTTNNYKFKQTEIGEIPENWQVVKIGDVAKSVSETYKFNDQPVVFLNTSDIYDGKILNNNLIKSKGLPGQAKKSIKIEDILFSEIRPANKRFAFVDFEAKNYVVSTKLMVIRALEKINPKYLYIVLTNPNLLNRFQILAESRSGTFPQITFDSIKNIEIPLPSKIEQESIVDSFFSVSNKIELNQKTIKTLEEIGQTLFKRWFIDFEFPNEKGESYKSNGGEMVDSELGEIPKGWSIGTVKDIATIKSGFAFKGDDLKKQGDFGIVKIKNVNDGVVNIQDTEYISESTSKKATNFKLSFGDVLIAMSGNTTGKIGIMPKTDLTFYLNQRVGKYFIKDKKEVLKGFLYFYITRPDIKQNTIEKAYGSAQPNISPSILESCEIVIPPTNEFETIFIFFNQIIFEISEKTYEIVKTSNLRDSLLPKLLSGKIRV